MDIVRISDMYHTFCYSKEYQAFHPVIQRAFDKKTFMQHLERYDVRHNRKQIKKVKYSDRVHYLRML